MQSETSFRNAVDYLVSMGFSRPASEFYLIRESGNVARAIEFLCNDPNATAVATAPAPHGLSIPDPDQQLVQTLMSMGFDQQACICAVHASPSKNIESLIEWILSNPQPRGPIPVPILIPATFGGPADPRQQQHPAAHVQPKSFPPTQTPPAPPLAPSAPARPTTSPSDLWTDSDPTPCFLKQYAARLADRSTDMGYPDFPDPANPKDFYWWRDEITVIVPESSESEISGQSEDTLVKVKGLWEGPITTFPVARPVPIHITNAAAVITVAGQISTAPDSAVKRTSAPPMSAAGVAAPKLPLKPPHWVPDEEATHCKTCSTPFKLFSRKHHCRRCGHVVCGDCSKYQMPIPEFGYRDFVRVCRVCFSAQFPVGSS